MKNIGKPYAGKPHVRFDEGGLVPPVPYSTLYKAITDIQYGVTEDTDGWMVSLD